MLLGQGVNALASVVLRGLDLGALLAGDADEPANTVRLPAELGHKLGEGGTLRAADQRQELRALGFAAGCFRLSLGLGSLLGFGRLSSREWPSSSQAAPPSRRQASVR